MLRIRFDILDRSDNCPILARYYKLEGFESSAIRNADDKYRQFLLFALTHSNTPIKFKEGKLQFFEASRSERPCDLITPYSNRELHPYSNTTVIFDVPPSTDYMMNLLACLSIYFNSHHIDSVEFFEIESFLKQLNAHLVIITKTPTILLSLMNKIVQLGKNENNQDYHSLMDFVRNLSATYKEQKEKLQENFGFIDLLKDCIEVELVNQFFDNSPKLQSLAAMDYKIIQSVKKLFAFKTKEEAHGIFEIFDLNSNYMAKFKENLINSLMGKLAHDGGSYHSDYTEIGLLEQSTMLVKDHKLNLNHYQNSYDYCHFYAKEKANEPIFKDEINHLCAHFGGSLEENCDVHQGLNVSLWCTPRFLQLGLINFDLIRLFFNAYHQTLQIVHFYQAAENYSGENLIKRLPKELIPPIIRQSNKDFAVLPEEFFTHAFAHGFNDTTVGMDSLFYQESKKQLGFTAPLLSSFAMFSPPLSSNEEKNIDNETQGLTNICSSAASNIKENRNQQPIQNEKEVTKKESQNEIQLSYLLYVCCFLDEISLPVAFFIPIIGQLYLGARLANNLQPLTNEKYSFFGHCSTSQANHESKKCQLDWNFAPL